MQVRVYALLEIEERKCKPDREKISEESGGAGGIPARLDPSKNHLQRYFRVRVFILIRRRNHQTGRRTKSIS